MFFWMDYKEDSRVLPEYVLKYYEDNFMDQMDSNGFYIKIAL